MAGGDARTISPQALDDGPAQDVALDKDGGGGGVDGEDGGATLARDADGRGTIEPFCMAALCQSSSLQRFPSVGATDVLLGFSQSSSSREAVLPWVLQTSVAIRVTH